jgi:hypothetical protein
VTARSGSAARPATTALETALPSASATRTGIFAVSCFPAPEKRNPKKVARRIGVTIPTTTERGSERKSFSSWRTIASACFIGRPSGRGR